MLLIKTFNPLKAKQVNTATNLSRVGTTDKVVAREVTGVITFQPFEATLMRGFEGISIDGDQSILVNVGNGFVSMVVARVQIKLITGPITLSLQLLRGKSFKSVSIGYWVDADPVTYLFNTGLPARLQAPWLLTRYLQSGEAIGGVNPIRIQETNDPIQTGNGVFKAFVYYPLIISTQNYYQGEEIPSVILRIEQYSNRRMMNGSDFVLKSIDEAHLQSIAECVDIDFELSIVAANTQDLLSGIDSITRSLSDGFVEAPPFGLSFGVQLSRSAIFDEMSQEIEFANLPSASMKLRVVNVPIGFGSSVADVLNEFEINRI
jgi:hypothetical protein